MKIRIFNNNHIFANLKGILERKNFWEIYLLMPNQADNLNILISYIKFFNSYNRQSIITMIQTLKEKIAKFRSQLHMSRYQKAIKEGQIIIQMLKELEKNKIGIDADGILMKNIQEELNIAIQLDKAIKENFNNENTSKNNQKREKQQEKQQKQCKRDQQFGMVCKSQVGQVDQIPQKVSKWGKKSCIKQEQSSPKKWPRTSQNMRQSQNFNSSSVFTKTIKQQEILNTKGDPTKLEQDERQIVQRQVMLPLNLPGFFKRKQAHRLIVCNFEKCNDLLQLLTKGISYNKDIVQLEQITQWVPIGIHKDFKIFVAPFQTDQQSVITKIIEDQKNILILYSDSERQILTQKPSNVKKEGFKINF